MVSGDVREVYLSKILEFKMNSLSEKDYWKQEMWERAVEGIVEQAGPLQASTLPISMKHTESTGLKKKKKKSPIDEIIYPLR